MYQRVRRGGIGPDAQKGRTATRKKKKSSRHHKKEVEGVKRSVETGKRRLSAMRMGQTPGIDIMYGGGERGAKLKGKKAV